MSEKEISFKIDWTPEQKKAFKDITGFTELDDDYIKIEQLLKVIEKQQKEINELKCAITSQSKHISQDQKEIKEYKEKNKKLREKCKELIKEKEELSTVILYDNIHKDKIKEKIKELEQIKNTALTERTVEMMEDKINILNLLLEENNNE